VKYGVDIINISGGEVIPIKKPAAMEINKPQSYSTYHHLDFAKRVKGLNLGVPVIGSGFSVFGKDMAAVGEGSVLNGYCDMMGIGRQSLVDPDVLRIIEGKCNYCSRCMGCIELLVAQMPVGCTQYDPVYSMIKESTRLTLEKVAPKTK
jgi:2,4-dienoyl-CoA reductase-like NADH-dependent reductase (Old Yellow Enzyme family)